MVGSLKYTEGPTGWLAASLAHLTRQAFLPTTVWIVTGVVNDSSAGTPSGIVDR